ncbi:hypothetical protein VPH35_109925 [Triticum aestivum]
MAPLFVSFLMNTKTYNRIWTCLQLGKTSGRKRVSDAGLVDAVWRYSASKAVENDSRSQLSHRSRATDDLGLDRFRLNESQLNAVEDSVAAMGSPSPSLKLIWGPPGTGKTKTISTILWAMLLRGHRTLTCAPTNTAVLEVASRVVQLVREFSNGGSGGCFLSDIVLLGNNEKMKVEASHELSAVFLDCRVERLSQCFSPNGGWGHCLRSLTDFLAEPVSKYQLYTDKITKDREEEEKKRNISSNVLDKKNKNVARCNKGNDHEKDRCNNQGDEQVFVTLSFKDFVRATHKELAHNLCHCIEALQNDFPRDPTTAPNFWCMSDVVEVTRVLGALLDAGAGDRHEAWVSDVGDACSPCSVSNDPPCKECRFRKARSLCLEQLEYLRNNLKLPGYCDKRPIEIYLLQRAKSILCTVSTSFRLYNVLPTDNQKPVGGQGQRQHKEPEIFPPLELLVVDEAAQLKECEAMIPLQLPCIRHAVFIGDERQLPALVKSKISENADFGRSIFERLISLGCRKHLLDTQYRMHPEISRFPVWRFYDGKVGDGANVVSKSHRRRLLRGNMFGPYSFINVHGGRESSEEHSRSPKNTIEIAVVSLIVERLFRGLSYLQADNIMLAFVCGITFSLYFWTPHHRVGFFGNKAIRWHPVAVQRSGEGVPGEAGETIRKPRWFLSQDKVRGRVPGRGGRCHHHIHGEEQRGWRGRVPQGREAYQRGSHKGQALLVGDWQRGDSVQEQVRLAGHCVRRSEATALFPCRQGQGSVGRNAGGSC